jgi:hypothetical protein
VLSFLLAPPAAEILPGREVVTEILAGGGGWHAHVLAGRQAAMQEVTMVDDETAELREPDTTSEVGEPGETSEVGEPGATSAAEEPVAKPGVEVAAWRRLQAAECRAFAGLTSRSSPEALRLQAGRLDAEAEAILSSVSVADGSVPMGAGGEVSRASESSGFVDTLRTHPGLVGVNASRHRLSLISDTGLVALALDTADTIQAANSLEKMLAHQLAAAHTAALQTHLQAMELLRGFGTIGSAGFRLRAFSMEAARLLRASARMMEATQRAALCLHRLRTGGQQTMVVQHVHVAEGGQAVIAGAVKTRGARKKPQGGC